MAETTVSATTTERVPATREETRYLIPPVDIYETDNELIVVADLPGVSKEDVHIRVEQNMLTIDGKASHGGDGESLLTEFELHNYFRQFQLGEEVNQDRIQAEMKYGVLRIVLPKAEKARPRMIPVASD